VLVTGERAEFRWPDQTAGAENSFNPMTPIRIKNRQQTRPAFVLSPKNTMPMTAVPAVATPVNAA
jgi:hypothetical protein